MSVPSLLSAQDTTHTGRDTTMSEILTLADSIHLHEVVSAAYQMLPRTEIGDDAIAFDAHEEPRGSSAC